MSEQLPSDTQLHEGTLIEDGHHCASNDCWCWKDRYQVVTRDNLEDLHHAVNAFIHQKGWKPIGGVSAVYRTWENARKGYMESETMWAQAMVRHV